METRKQGCGRTSAPLFSGLLSTFVMTEFDLISPMKEYLLGFFVASLRQRKDRTYSFE